MSTYTSLLNLCKSTKKYNSTHGVDLTYMEYALKFLDPKNNYDYKKIMSLDLLNIIKFFDLKNYKYLVPTFFRNDRFRNFQFHTCELQSKQLVPLKAFRFYPDESGIYREITVNEELHIPLHQIPEDIKHTYIDFFIDKQKNIHIMEEGIKYNKENLIYFVAHFLEKHDKAIINEINISNLLNFAYQLSPDLEWEKNLQDKSILKNIFCNFINSVIIKDSEHYFKPESEKDDLKFKFISNSAPSTMNDFIPLEDILICFKDGWFYRLIENFTEVHLELYEIPAFCFVEKYNDNKKSERCFTMFAKSSYSNKELNYPKVVEFLYNEKQKYIEVKYDDVAQKLSSDSIFKNIIDMIEYLKDDISKYFYEKDEFYQDIVIENTLALLHEQGYTHIELLDIECYPKFNNWCNEIYVEISVKDNDGVALHSIKYTYPSQNFINLSTNINTFNILTERKFIESMSLKNSEQGNFTHKKRL